MGPPRLTPKSLEQRAKAACKSCTSLVACVHGLGGAELYVAHGGGSCESAMRPELSTTSWNPTPTLLRGRRFRPVQALARRVLSAKFVTHQP
jgi:hypothetical protein